MNEWVDEWMNELAPVAEWPLGGNNGDSWNYLSPLEILVYFL
jgi:hypothetical protein